MAALDAVNARFGRGALRPLATGIARPWGTRHGRMSPRYTTRVNELTEATAW
jgi:DNA polymerase V